MSAHGTNGTAVASEVDERQSGSGLLAVVRPEEWLLLAILLFCILLCIRLGGGFDGATILSRYFAFFAQPVLLVFLATRVLFAGAARWAPAPASRAEALKHFVFGREPSRGRLLETDLEVARGLITLFCTLTVYTNVKLRIPLINGLFGDPSFQRLDHALFGKEIWPWLERSVQANDALASFLESVYFHDYNYFVLLVMLLYLRRDRLGLRWIFQAVAFTYILGVLITVAYPSLGPCFFRRADYQWVQESMGMVASVQAGLWEYFSYVVQAGHAGMEVEGRVFMGIAAFPSLHVGHMALLTIVAWKRYPLYVPLAAAMTFLTFVGTMAFGWHYAIDAPAGIALAWIVCALLWRFLSRRDEQPALREG